nr:MAG: RNA-dependent RNA polymerase [Culex hudovirus]
MSSSESETGGDVMKVIADSATGGGETSEDEQLLEETLIRERTTMLRGLMNSCIISHETDVQAALRSRTLRPRNRQLKVPVGLFEETYTESGVLTGFKLKITNSDASLKSIRSTKYHINKKSYPANFPHDYVLKAFIEEGDSKLKDTFPNIPDEGDDLTPDIVMSMDNETFIVVELATRMSNTVKSMEKAYQEKLIKYKRHLIARENCMNSRLDRHDQEKEREIIVRYGIIVVSYDKIVTNINLEPEIVDELCMRYRFACAMQPGLAAKNLVRVPESELDSEAQAILAAVSAFKFSDHVTDAELESSGFPEFTKSNYDRIVMRPVSMEKFQADVDAILSKSIEMSGFIDATGEPAQILEQLRIKSDKKRMDYEMRYNEYLANHNSNEDRTSRKRIIHFPFLNLVPDSYDGNEELTEIIAGLKEAIKSCTSHSKSSDGTLKGEVHQKIVQKEQLYSGLWLDMMEGTLELNRNSTKDPIGECSVHTCETWEKVLEEIEEDDDELNIDAKQDKNINDYCHDLESALYDGGVDKAFNDRRSYKRVKADRLSDDDRIMLATKGVQGKALRGREEVVESRNESKKSLRMDNDVSDIDDFLNGFVDMSTLMEVPELKSFDSMVDLILTSLSVHNELVLLVRLLDWIKLLVRSRIGLCLYTATSLFLEINASIKQHCKKDQFIVKRLREFPVWIVIKPTNSQSHIFYSFLWRRSDEINIYTDDDSDLPTRSIFSKHINVGNDLRCTPFLSINRSKLPNLCQSFPKLVVHLSYAFDDSKVSPIGEGSVSSNHEIFYDPDEDQDLESYSKMSDKTNNAPQGTALGRIRKLWKTVLLLTVVSLHNKAEVEEHLTLSRFIYMEGFVQEPAIPDPGKLIDKLKPVIRSRLTIWVIRRLDKLIMHIFRTGGFKLAQDLVIGSKRKTQKRTNMWNFFIDEKMDDEGEAINSFYYGYAVDKNQQPESNMTGQLYEKILELEDKFVDDDIGRIGIEEPMDVTNPKYHYYSMNMIKGLCSSSLSRLRDLYGQDPLEKNREEFLNLYKRMTVFDTLGTLKSSSNFCESNQSPDSDLPKRGRLIQVAKEKIYSGKTFMHELFMESLINLINQRSIFCDLFKKNQHGGLREIYILSVDTRIVQHFIETCSRALCRLSYSETMTNPDSKVELLKEHNDLVRKKFKKENTITLCTSDDARKWNQGHYCHKFYVMMCHLMPPEFHEVFRAICFLWCNKKILINENLLACFKKNPDFQFSSEIINKMKSVYRAESAPERWMDNGSRYIKVRTGMMQGILHYTSSLFHTVANEFVKERVTIMIRHVVSSDPAKFLNHPERLSLIRAKKNPLLTEPVVTVMQSSDDSAMLITTPVSDGISQSIMSFLCLASFNFKHLVGSSIGIHLSPKSTTNTMNIMEFNSVWYFMGNRYQPYLKQCLASLTVSESGNLLMRMQESYTAITSCLEHGSSSLSCSSMQMAQAMQHYFFMGATMTHNFLHFAKYLRKLRLPTIGFFLLDHPALTGIPGFECLHYILARLTSLKYYYKEVYGKCEKTKDLDEKRKVINEDTVAPSLHNSICQISHGQNNKLARLKELMDLPEDWLEQLNADPSPLVRRAKNREEAQLKVAAKLHTPGLSNTFSSAGIFSNIAAESVYILTSKCNVISNPSSIMDMTDYKKLSKEAANEMWLKSVKRKENKLKDTLGISNDSSEEGHDDSGLGRFIKITQDQAMMQRERNQVKKFSLLSIAEKMLIEHNRMKMRLENMSDADRIIEEAEAISYLSQCFARYEDYNLILDNMSSVEVLSLYRDDKALKNKYMKIKVTSSLLEDNLKPYDVVVMKLLGERTVTDHRAADYAWNSLRRRYQWLKQTWEETLLASPFTDSIQLLNFLSRLDKSGREVKLQGVSMFESIPGEQITNLIGCNLARGFSTNVTSPAEVEQGSESGSGAGPNIDRYLRNARKEGMLSVRVGAHYLAMCSLFPLKPDAMNYCLETISKHVKNNQDFPTRRMKAFDLLFGYSSGKYDAKKVLRICEERNIGLIGGYTMAQRYDKITNQYYDTGVWEGKYEGVGIKILIMSRKTSEEIPASTLSSRKRELDSLEGATSSGFRIVLRHKVASFIAKVTLDSEIPPRELESLLKRWCETNRVVNDYTMTPIEFDTFYGNKMGITTRKRQTPIEYRECKESPTEIVVGCMSNFVMHPKVGVETIGARIHIDKNYKKFKLFIEEVQDTDLVITCSENMTFRLNLSIVRSEVDLTQGAYRCKSQGPSGNSKKSDSRFRSHFTILSITPNMKDLVGRFSILSQKKIMTDLGYLNTWIHDETLKVDDAIRLLSRLVSETWSESTDGDVDLRSLTKISRSMLLQFLLNKGLKTGRYVESSGEENVGDRPNKLVNETNMGEQLEVNAWIIENINKCYATVHENYKEMKKDDSSSSNPMVELESGVRTGSLRFWMHSVFDDLDDPEDMKKVGNERLPMVERSHFVHSKTYFHAYFSTITKEEWTMMIEKNLLPRRLNNQKLLLEVLLSSENESVHLSEATPESENYDSDFPVLRARQRGRFEVE